MNKLFDRGKFRTDLYNIKTELDAIRLILSLEESMRSVNALENLSDPEKAKVLDQYKTAMNVCWDRLKSLISDKYLTADTFEKEYYKRKQQKDLLKKEDLNVEGLFSLELFKNDLSQIKTNQIYKYLYLIVIQLDRMNDTIQCDNYVELHVLNKRKQKDMYFNSINECWKLYNQHILSEFPLLLESKKDKDKKKHIQNRRKRHAEKGIQRKEWKDTKKKLIEEMNKLTDEEFHKLQDELEKEYRRTRGLPPVPEV